MVVGVSMKMIGQNVLNHVYNLNIEHVMIPNLLLVVNVLGKTENLSFVMMEIAKVTLFSLFLNLVFKKDRTCKKIKKKRSVCFIILSKFIHLNLRLKLKEVHSK